MIETLDTKESKIKLYSNGGGGRGDDVNTQ